MTSKTRELELEMSNFDHTVDAGLAEALRADLESFARHNGYNFNGLVRWNVDRGCFSEEVFVRHVHQETFYAETLEKLMEVVNDKYGWE